jgi:hypothetical protein
MVRIKYRIFWMAFPLVYKELPRSTSFDGFESFREVIGHQIGMQMQL